MATLSSTFINVINQTNSVMEIFTISLFPLKNNKHFQHNQCPLKHNPQFSESMAWWVNRNNILVNPAMLMILIANWIWWLSVVKRSMLNFKSNLLIKTNLPFYKKICPLPRTFPVNKIKLIDLQPPMKKGSLSISMLLRVKLIMSLRRFLGFQRVEI